jgi:hypothetical protein
MEFRKCNRCKCNDVVRVPNDVGEARWKYICLRCTAEYKPLILSPEEISRLSNACERRNRDWKKGEIKNMEDEWVDTTERAQHELRKQGWKTTEIIL